MIFRGEIKDAKMSKFSSDFRTLIQHQFPLYFLYELLLRLRMLYHQFTVKNIILNVIGGLPRLSFPLSRHTLCQLSSPGSLARIAGAERDRGLREREKGRGLGREGKGFSPPPPLPPLFAPTTQATSSLT